MKKQTNYQQAKAAKKAYKNDKPAQRMIINDHCDFLCKDYKFSEHYRDLLANYSCTLHPKN